MANVSVSNRFFVLCINDGASVSAVLRSTKTLSLMYNSNTKTVFPDWSSKLNGNPDLPIIYAVVRVGGEVKMPLSYTWKYNGRTLCTNLADITDLNDASKFEKTTFNQVEGTTYTLPALKIKDNFAGSNNTDMDVITFSGKVEVTGNELDFVVELPIRISLYSGSGYFGVISGDAEVTNGTEPTTYDATTDVSGYTAHMQAELINGSSPVLKFNTKWYREGTDTTNPFMLVSTTNGTAIAYINASLILDFATIRCDYYIPKTDSEQQPGSYSYHVYSAYWDVDDMLDEEEMYIRNGGVSGKNSSFIRSNETAQFEFYMARRTDPYALDKRFNKFEVRYLNSNGENVDMSNYGSLDKISNGWLDVTVTDNTITVGELSAENFAGRVTLSYDLVKALGTSMTGIIKATGTITEPTAA